jgi:hypothetical protein
MIHASADSNSTLQFTIKCKYIASRFSIITINKVQMLTECEYSKNLCLNNIFLLLTVNCQLIIMQTLKSSCKEEFIGNRDPQGLCPNIKKSCAAVLFLSV